jgi:hypothetical protein
MKAISSLTLGAALIVTGVAFAQAPPTATDSSSNNSDIMQNNAPANTTPSKATDANANDASATSQSVSQACEKQAADKRLSGDDKSAWVKKCKMGKTTRQDH